MIWSKTNFTGVALLISLSTVGCLSDNSQQAEDMRLLLEDSVRMSKDASESLSETRQIVTRMDAKLKGLAGGDAEGGAEKRAALDAAAISLQSSLSEVVGASEVQVLAGLVPGMVRWKGVDQEWRERQVFFQLDDSGNWELASSRPQLLADLGGGQSEVVANSASFRPAKAVRPTAAAGASSALPALDLKPAAVDVDAERVELDSEAASASAESGDLTDPDEWVSAFRAMTKRGIPPSEIVNGIWHDVRGRRVLVPRSMLPIPPGVE